MVSRAFASGGCGSPARAQEANWTGEDRDGGVGALTGSVGTPSCRCAWAVVGSAGGRVGRELW